MNESRFNRGSWLALGASTLLLATILFLNAYRYTLPTDGWTLADPLESEITENILGLPSSLQPGDRIISIEDVPLEELYGTRPESWRPGGTVQYTIQRGEQTLTAPVPIGRWNLIALEKGMLTDWRVYLIGLLNFLIGGFVFIRRPGNLGAQVLLFLGTVQLVMSLGAVIPLSLADGVDAFSLTAVILLGYYIWGILLFPTILLFSLVFPKPKWPFRRHPVFTLAFLYLLEPILVIIIGGPSAKAGPFVGFGLVAVFGLLTVISVLHTLITERNDLVARAQIMWVGLGVALVAGFQFVVNVIGLILASFASEVSPAPWWEGYIFGFVYLALPITIAVAILRYRLFDIDVIVRKSLVYAVLTATLALVFFGGVTLLQQTFGALTGTENSPMAIVLSTLVIAALFNPLRRRVQEFIDRRFYRKKYDAEQALARFAARARDETDIEQLGAELSAVVEETMQPEIVSLWLKPHTRKR